MDFLPISIPPGLTARDYYELGLRYRLAGWVGLARESLSLTIELDQEGRLQAKARKVMKTQLPRLPVPPHAEQRNIEGYNLMATEKEQAKAIFQEMTRQYPDFEWPFSNLAKLYIAEGKIAEAKGIGKYLLSVNPDLLRTLTIMMEVSLAEKDFDAALKYVQKTLEHYPSDDQFRQLALLIKVQTKGMPPDTIPEGLSPEEYYELGVDYEMTGKLGLSFAAFKLAIEADPESALAVKAKTYQRSHLPNRPVSAEIEQRYQQAASLVTSNKDMAQDELEKLAMEIPDFEFPVLMLATLALQEDNMKKAERLLRRTLACNPNLTVATSLLVSIFVNEGKISEGLALIEKSLATLDWPDDGLDLDILRAQLQLAGRQEH